MEIKQIKINKIKPNNYNPNKMTEERYKELIEEIKYLGRIPKPIILDTNYTIIDGEHTYKASKELKLKEIPCEIVKADDFEKRRLTYKYNQHGEHDPVLLGTMFKQMIDLKKISQRELSKQINVSEGTVRNALLFLEVQNEVRNGYAVNKFSVRQIRMFEYLRKEINPTLAELWLKSGGEKEDLIEMIRYSFKTFKIKESVEAVLARGEKLQTLAEEAIKLDVVCWQGINKYGGFINICKKAISRQMFLRKVISAVFPWRDGMERTRGFFALHFERVWPLTDEFWFISTLKFLLSEKAEFLLTPEELKEVCEEAKEYTSNVRPLNYTDFQEDFLNRKIKSKCGALKKKSFYEVEKEIYINKLEEAPDYIKEAKFRKYNDEPDFKAMYDLWQLKESEDVKRILAREGFKPGVHNFDDVIARVRRGLGERDLKIKFDTLTPEQTVEETVKFLKDACKQFALSVGERDFLDNEFEESLTEFLKNCKVEKYLSFALYSISGRENWIASFRRDFGR
jgi:ParB/RepB/Spo0J family partition protein